MRQANGKSRRASELEPTWEVAHLFPAQGAWTEGDYLELDGNHLVEFSNGFLEVLPMPTITHQLIVGRLYGLLLALASSRDLGTVLFAPVRIRLWSGKFREPDIVFMRKENADRTGDEFCERADLVMEVVSGDDRDRDRDLIKKRQDYARAGIPEYWIVDPREERITVLRLVRKRYIVHGEFGKGATASSHLLPGFTVNVSAALSSQVRRSSTAKARPKSKRPPSA